MAKNLPVSVPDMKSRLAPANPIPGRAVISFPTPIISDNIITEFVSAETGTYQALPYGTKWDDLHHGAFQKAYPDFELVYQEPADPNAYAYRRIWCNPRISQQVYDYSIEYESQSPDYPIITRLEVVKRADYVPSTPLTPDTKFPQALLVQEKLLNQTTPTEINSLYVTIAKVFRSLPGPVVTTYDFDAAVNASVRTDRQMVLSTDIFDPTTVPLLLQAQESDQDSAYYKLRAISYFESLPATRVEYQTGKYPFPTLVTGIELGIITLTTTPPKSFVQWSPAMRDDPTVPALYKVVTEFFASSPTPDTIYTLNTQNLVYRGISYSISINSVLNDAIDVNATFSGDPNFGDLSESFHWDATVPSATEYLALIGTYVIAGSDITQWRGAVFTRVTTSVLLI